MAVQVLPSPPMRQPLGDPGLFAQRLFSMGLQYKRTKMEAQLAQREPHPGPRPSVLLSQAFRWPF